MINWLYNVIWDQELWLPNGNTWENMNKHNDFSRFNTFYSPLIAAVIIVILRIIVEK
jgi:hypothetical protein